MPKVHLACLSSLANKVGEVRRSLLPLLGEYPETFDVDEDSVRLAPALITASLEERSRAVARVMEKVRGRLH